MDGTVSFVEFGAGDPAAAGPFLAKLFGWSFHPMGSGGYLETPSGRAGMHGQDPEQVYIYYRVADLAAAMKRIEELGGTAKPQGDGDTDFGRFADCTGPGGIRFGLHQKPG
jgi:predicted enzyme related to lactoylglutathione lyase